HPLSEHRKQLRANGYISLHHASRLVGKRNVRAAATIQAVKTIRTKRGDPMAFLTLSDEQKEMEAVVFPELYRKTNRWLDENKLIFVRGNIESRNNQIQFIVNEMKPFDLKELKEIPDRRLFIKIVNQNNDEALQFIKKLALKFPGKIPIIVYHKSSNRTYQLSSEFYIHPTYDCMQSFYNYFKKDNVVLENR